MAAYAEPTRLSHLALVLHYGVVMILVGLAAWGLSLLRATGTRSIPPRPEPWRAGHDALTVRSALTFPTIDRPGAEVKSMVLAELPTRERLRQMSAALLQMADEMDRLPDADAKITP
jgi:hypothetical protein